MLAKEAVMEIKPLVRVAGQMAPRAARELPVAH
jgi:hypothetical protein